jgi:hypothetical protein
MILSKGFVYRLGRRIKGERMGRFPVLRLFSGPVIGLGIAVSGSVLNLPIIGEM